MDIAIAGAGICGLATACAMALRGFSVKVYEQAPSMGEIGAGLQVSPNGWRVLEGLGVADTLADAVFEPPEIELRLGGSGRRVWRLGMGDAARARWGAPYVLVHRADLANALAARLDALQPGAIETGQRCVGYSHDPGDRPALLMDDGTHVASDMVVGADGLHSAVRADMLGPENPRYTGNLAWRALVPVEDLGTDAPPANVVIWAGAGRHCVTTRVRGGSVVNFVGMIETPDPGAEGWRIEGRAEDVIPLFDGWVPAIRQVLAKAQTLHRWALFARAPLPRWSEGPVTIVGDAAHPMLPSFAQGAVQALEDAWALAAFLAKSGDPAEAGARLYRERIDRTSRIQQMSAENAQMFHRAGFLTTPIYYGGMAAVARLMPSVLLQRQDWVYSKDVVSEFPLEA